MPQAYCAVLPEEKQNDAQAAAAQLPALGISELSCPGGSPEHAQYLEKMGFVPQGDGRYAKRLAGQ